MTQRNNTGKTSRFLLSEQVKTILQRNGISQHFNYSEYEEFKTKCKRAFNLPNAIANEFIKEYQDQSDLNAYIF